MSHRSVSRSARPDAAKHSAARRLKIDDRAGRAPNEIEVDPVRGEIHVHLPLLPREVRALFRRYLRAYDRAVTVLDAASDRRSNPARRRR